MKKVLIALVVMLALSMFSFATGVSDPLLGPHNLNGVKGCTSCHSPHNGSAGQTNGSTTTGATYLWARAFNTAAFQTYAKNGVAGTMQSAGPIESDPNAHSILCMSCHDNGVTDATMGAISMGADTQLGENLTSTHPIDVKYTSTTATSYDWAITIASGKATFNNASFVGGHPARLYVDAAGANAYVECSTCHNPHAWQNAVVTIAGTPTAKKTDKFVRGWYDPTDGASQANFCRSCHFSKTMDYQTNAGTQPS